MLTGLVSGPAHKVSRHYPLPAFRLWFDWWCLRLAFGSSVQLPPSLEAPPFPISASCPPIANSSTSVFVSLLSLDSI